MALLQDNDTERVYLAFSKTKTERVYMALLEYNGFIARQRHRASIHSFIARQRHRASIHSFIARQPHRASIHKFITRQRHRASIHSFIARQRHRASIYTALLQDKDTERVYTALMQDKDTERVYTALLQDKDAELVYTALRIHDVNSTRLTSVTVFNFTHPPALSALLLILSASRFLAPDVPLLVPEPFLSSALRTSSTTETLSGFFQISPQYISSSFAFLLFCLQKQ